MSDSVIVSVNPLGFPWQTSDPFLTCIYHQDAFPAGNDRMGPAASLAGRNLGQDFEGKDGWRMYHGEVVPGFPSHPHRGFETVTIVRRGFVDHSDSVGAAARYGNGDVQWLTAGGGVQHSEMFPLVDPQRPNPLELFQIWLNLPRAAKLAPPHFVIFWNDAVPRHHVRTGAGATEVAVVAGALGELRPLPPPPDSWASHADADVAIWTIRMTAGATWTLPPATPAAKRTLYYFGGLSLRVGGRAVPPQHAIEVRPDVTVPLESGDEVELLLLQGRPIGEPVVQYGPFVMNSRAEIEQTINDYRRTQFGGWPWPSSEPVHPRDAGRFARYPDGRVERAG